MNRAGNVNPFKFSLNRRMKKMICTYPSQIVLILNGLLLGNYNK
jgi:hypothetical protein